MLTGVTISGADDQVDPADLIALSAEFPFVEWGVLVSSSRLGGPRYPTRRWMVELENRTHELFIRRGQRMNLSAHFCGEVAREALANRLHPLPVLERVQRIQINGYSPPSPGVVRFARAMPSFEIILQVRDEASLQDAARDVEEIGNASILFDPSGGTGHQPFGWPRRPLGVELGYAGGIGPDNVLDVLRDIGAVASSEFWIDMESGVRTDDVFDLAKVRAVLEKCAPFVGVPS